MAKTLRSTMSGIWLMQTVRLSIPVPCKVEYTVRHKGKGNNELRVRFGNFWNLIWAKIHDFDLEHGDSASRSLDFTSDTTGSDDGMTDIRWRLSRAILTKAIDWELTYTVTRLKDGTDATGACSPTITSEKDAD